jgi:hypothetical protein
MTLVKCLNCGSAQDYDVVVGYCEQCGRKLPVPLKRGKDTVRQQLRHGTGGSEVGVVNVAITVVLALAGLAAVVAVAVVIIRSML